MEGAQDCAPFSALHGSHNICLGPGHGWPWIGVQSCPTVVPGLLLGAQKACGVEEARAVLGSQWPGPVRTGEAQNGSRAGDGASRPGLIGDPAFPLSPPCSSCGFLEPGRRAASAFPAGPGQTEASGGMPALRPPGQGLRGESVPSPRTGSCSQSPRHWRTWIWAPAGRLDLQGFGG